jgi:integrase
MSKTFTDLSVRNRRPDPGGRVEIPDGGQRGLYLIVQPSGTKSWAVRYRFNGKPQKLTLQSGLSLAAARKIAADHMFQLAQGIDPREAKRAKAEAATLADESTVQAVCQRYMEIEGKKLRSASNRASTLTRFVYPAIGHRPISEINRDEITAMLDKIAVKKTPASRKSGKKGKKIGGERAADMTLAILRKIFNWHETRSSKFRSPIVRGMARVKPAERARDRTLDDNEIKRVWGACGDPKLGTYGQCVRFMLLTGARRSEAARLRRSEIEIMRSDGIDVIVWKLPTSRSKNKQPVFRPLSKAALSIIEEQPIIGDDDSGFVFTLDGRRAMNMNYQDKKWALDELSGASGWTLHDTRRTFRTLLSRLRVPFDTAERCLGHSQPLIVRTYDRDLHLGAMLEAFERVAAEIEHIVTGDSGKVIRPNFSAR